MRFTCLRPGKEHPGEIVGPRNCIRDIHGSTTWPTPANLVGEDVASRIDEELLGSVRSREGEEWRVTPDGNVAGRRRFSIKLRRQRVDILEEETEGR